MTRAGGGQALGKKRLRAIANRGHYSEPPIMACAETGIDAILPKPATSNAKAEGRFDRSDFIYIAKDDEYQCPASRRAIHRFAREENGLQLAPLELRQNSSLNLAFPRKKLIEVGTVATPRCSQPHACQNHTRYG